MSDMQVFNDFFSAVISIIKAFTIKHSDTMTPPHTHTHTYRHSQTIYAREHVILDFF